jgi:hypothetical protein
MIKKLLLDDVNYREEKQRFLRYPLVNHLYLVYGFCV